MAWVSWRYPEDNVAAGKNVNVVFAFYVTTQARLKLYEYLSKLGKSVLYCDIDSVIYIKKKTRCFILRMKRIGDVELHRRPLIRAGGNNT
jgi:hypothetical protein